jgi:hypothetical protein
MFAILIFEREPLQWADLGKAVQGWVQDAGAFAALALLVWCLAYVFQRPANPPPWTWRSRLFVLATAAAAACYGIFFALLAAQGTIPDVIPGPDFKPIETWTFTPLEKTFLTAAGACALVAVLIPVFFGLSRLRGRRIWAVARLSIKETVRNRVLWVFTILILVVLFASWFLDSSEKPEFQLRNYVWVVDTSMTILLILAASLLAAFSIPSDVKSQTIHTVVTKPVERFEIVLGRLLGYTLLMTAVLLVVTGLGLVYLTRSINPKAMEESYKARVPIYGTLAFKGTAGEDVGREWTHRKYISGPARGSVTAPQYAQWSFATLPDRLADRPGGVVCEFSFDIFKTHKGEEGKGIFCTFMFVTNNCKLVERTNGRLEPENREEINQRREQLKNDPDANNKIAEEFGFFELPSRSISDYHTEAITLPAGLFRNLRNQGENVPQAGNLDDLDSAALRILVNVHQDVISSKAQLVGVATHDLYLLDDEKTFEENFFKGAIGLWYRLLLVIVLAVCLSTYLSGIISWIGAMFLFCLGLFKDDITQIALGTSAGGGPVESMIRLVNRHALAVQLEKTPAVRVATWFDESYRWVLSHFLKLIPDVGRYDLSKYVANGFDISWGSVLLVDNLIPLVGYLLPWVVLGYYLMKYREVANPT